MLDSRAHKGIFLAVLAALFLAAPVSAGIPVEDLVPPTDDVPAVDPSDVRDEVRQEVREAVPEKPDRPLPTEEAEVAAEQGRAAMEAWLAWVQGELATLVPEDPVGLVERQLKPVHDTANEIQATVIPARGDVEAPPAATATVTEAPIVSEENLLMASATAAAAAALAILWLAGSSGSVGAGAAGATGAGGKLAATDLKRLLPFASPLFTRFEKDTVLGHPKREALYGLILQSPGVSLQSLCDATGLSRTAVTHHLRLLELQHLIVSKRMGRSRHYYENGGRFGRDQKEALAILQNPRSKEVATFVKDHPGAIQKALCAALGLQPSIAHWHLSRLQQAQIVESVRSGRTVSYFPGAAFKGTDQPIVPASVLAAPTAA